MPGVLSARRLGYSSLSLTSRGGAELRGFGALPKVKERNSWDSTPGLPNAFGTLAPRTLGLSSLGCGSRPNMGASNGNKKAPAEILSWGCPSWAEIQATGMGAGGRGVDPSIFEEWGKLTASTPQPMGVGECYTPNTGEANILCLWSLERSRAPSTE